MALDNVQKIELDIDAAKKMIRKRDLLASLRKNPDFIELFVDGFLYAEAARLVGLKQDPEMQTVEQQNFIDNSIIGIGTFNQYLMDARKLGDMAENSMKSAERLRESELTQNRGVN